MKNIKKHKKLDVVCTVYICRKHLRNGILPVIFFNEKEFISYESFGIFVQHALYRVFQNIENCCRSLYSLSLSPSPSFLSTFVSLKDLVQFNKMEKDNL